MKLHKNLSLVFVLLITSFAFGQQNRIDLLNGRFSFVFPDSAKNIARGTDIMSADPNTNNETRVIYDIGDQRIVFFAEELYAKSHPQLEAEIKKQISATNQFITKQLFKKDSVQAISIVPSIFDKTQNAILTNSLIVQNADSTLSKLNVYLNPQAFKNKQQFDAITTGVLSSFQKGSRKLNLQSHIDSFPVLGTKTILKLPLPKDYIVTVDRKYDFEVYKIQKVVGYGDYDYGDLIMYYGFHPSMFSNEYSLEKFKTAATDGEFMFQKFKWENYYDKSRKLLVREQLFQDDDIQKEAQIHLALVSNSSQRIEELSAIVKIILLKYDK